MEEIGELPVPVAHHAFKGEVSRIILETLRKTTQPLSTGELTKVVMKERGQPVAGKRRRRTMTQRVGALLNHWRRVRGVLKSSPGPGDMLIWEIAQKPG